MDPLNWKRAGVLAVIGIAIGLGAARLDDATNWHPLVAPLLCAAGAAVVAFTLRKCEVLNCLVETAFFTYGSFVGMAIVRTVNNYLEYHVANVAATPVTLLEGLNLVTFAAGIPFTFAVLFLVALPVWSLAQLSKHKPTERDERFWEFVDDQTRR